MGMSDDFETAVAEGATMVRLGRVIFGERAGASGGHASSAGLIVILARRWTPPRVSPPSTGGPSSPRASAPCSTAGSRTDVFRRSLELRKDGKPYVFYEGPPTANGKPGIHHVLTRSFKDLFPRYMSMRGYAVARKGGWDTHGLPVELEVEKSLKISGKRQIEEFGVARFNELCRAVGGRGTSTSGRR